MVFSTICRQQEKLGTHQTASSLALVCDFIYGLAIRQSPLLAGRRDLGEIYNSCLRPLPSSVRPRPHSLLPVYASGPTSIGRRQYYSSFLRSVHLRCSPTGLRHHHNSPSASEIAMPQVLLPSVTARTSVACPSLLPNTQPSSVAISRHPSLRPSLLRLASASLHRPQRLSPPPPLAARTNLHLVMELTERVVFAGLQAGARFI